MVLPVSPSQSPLSFEVSTRAGHFLIIFYCKYLCWTGIEKNDDGVTQVLATCWTLSFSSQQISQIKIFRIKIFPRKVLKYFTYELLKIFDHRTGRCFIIFTYFQCQYVERSPAYCYIFTKLHISLPYHDGVRVRPDLKCRKNTFYFHTGHAPSN